MNLYFVSYYMGINECIGLFQLDKAGNDFCLKYVFGHEKRDKQLFLNRINRPVYFIESLIGKKYEYKMGYPFKPEYLNNLVSKEELDGLLLC